MIISFKTFLFCLMMFFSFGFLSAQTLNLRSLPTDKMQFGFSINKPFYSSQIDMSTFSGAYELNCNIPLSSGLNIVGEFSYMSTSYSIDYGFIEYEYKNNGLGNIFIGLQTRPNSSDNSKSIASFGVYLPTAEQMSINGFFINYYEIQKFASNSLGLYFNYAFHKIIDESFKYGFEIGPNILIPTKGEYSETEIFLHYGASTGYQINKLLINVEFLGIGILSQQVDNFFDRLVHQIAFGAQWKETAVTPKIYYRIFLRDEIRQMVDGVLGIGVTVSID